MTDAQRKALQIARTHGQVYAGWNPGTRDRVSATVLRALSRAGLLSVATVGGGLVGTLTRAGASVAEIGDPHD